MISFLPIESDIQLNSIPLILIDTSGSTGDRFKGEVSVRDYEFTVAGQICHKSGYSQAHLITWSTHAEIHENVSLENFDQIRTKTCSSGGTSLICGLDLLHGRFFDKDKLTEIIIITDGEIQDSIGVIVTKLSSLATNPVQIKIIAVEPNEKDYFNSNVSVGNHLYKIIRDGKLTRLVERFSIYNRHEVEFINMSNPQVRIGYLPYAEKMFLVKDFNQFVQFIKDEIKALLSEKDNRSKMLKMIQNLAQTIYNYTKDKSYQNQLMIVDLFSNLLRGTTFYSDMRSLLLSEVNNHMTGKISTFSELKKARYMKIENTIMDLMKDVRKSITMTPRDFNYSFSMADLEGVHYIIKSYDKQLSSIRMGSSTYNGSSLNLENYQIPLMFDFDDLPNSSALQWMKLIYSNRLNVSISNEYLYYYLLCDAYLVKETEVASVYHKYVELALSDLKYGTEITIAQEIGKNNMINIPYGILQDAIKYCGLTIKPLTLYYLICRQYLIKYVCDASKPFVLDNLRKFCEKDLLLDLKQETLDWVQVETQLDHIHLLDVKIVVINREDTSFLKQHQYLADVDCPCRVGIRNDQGEICCELCGSLSEYLTIERNAHFDQLGRIRPEYLYDNNCHIHLGMLDGIPDDDGGDDLLLLDRFDTKYTSFSLDNTMITDPISNSRLKITTQEEFIKFTDHKYPFLRDIKMDNIALCGGFVRSILLKQQMKDFDFFFYGLANDQEYIERVKILATDLVHSLKKIDKEYKFAIFYKPLFNVIEMICYEDPKNHIKEDFTLDYFDQYKFKSMKKYKCKERPKDKKSIETKYYFEDNDEHGVKMKYRFQLVMCKYATIMDIFRSFDMFPSMVAYDGHHVFFTKKSLTAYRYMINEINLHGGTDMAKQRASKYFKYGFALVFPPSTRNWQAPEYQNDYSQEGMRYRGTNESIGPLKFKVRQVIGNVIYVNHNSNMEQLLERNLKLEKKAKKKGTALYTSSMFCSFIAVLRYVKINEINYRFPIGDAIYDLFEGDQIKLKTLAKMIFFNEQKSIYKTTEWYDKFARSIILNQFIN